METATSGQDRLELPRSQDELGATAVEYGLLVALVAVPIITVVTALGQKLPGGFNTVINYLPW